MLNLIMILILIVAVIVSLIWFYASRTKRKANTEPIIELEKLVNCKSCESLIPEVASKCAFCGRSQIRNRSTVDQ
jgi:hypothetical protein